MTTAITALSHLCLTLVGAGFFGFLGVEYYDALGMIQQIGYVDLSEMEI